MISFTHEDVTILNPFVAIGMASAVTPEAYGFVLNEDGTWVKTLNSSDAIRTNGTLIELTRNDLTLVSHALPTEDEIEEYFEARFIAWWGTSFTLPVGEGPAKVVDASFFSEDRGYSPEEQHGIHTLISGGAWQSPDYSDHLVFRLPSSASADALVSPVAGVQPPTVVIEINGGAFYCARSTAPVRVIVLDEDVEGSDGDRVMEVNDTEYYVHDYRLSMQCSGDAQDGIDPAFVNDIIEQIDAG
jgi:hypothetical protein